MSIIRYPPCSSAVCRSLVVLTTDPVDLLQETHGLGLGLETADQAREGLDPELTPVVGGDGQGDAAGEVGGGHVWLLVKVVYHEV